MPVVTGSFPASVCWGTDFARVAVYTQAWDGHVWESQWNGSTWVPPTRLFLTTPGAPVAAVGIQGSSDPAVSPSIRLYYYGVGDILRELCYDNSDRGWYNGPLGDLNIPLHPGTRIAACALGTQQRVYFQEPTNGATQEWRFDGATWTKGTTLPAKAQVGSNLTACYNYGTPRIYYETDDDFIREQAWDEPTAQWKTGLFVYPAAGNSQPRTSYAITVAGNEGTTNMYLTWPGGEIAETKWVPGFTLPLQVGTAKGMPGTNLSACTSLSNPKFKRVYYQTSSQDIGELCNDGGDWYFGSGVPTPAVS